MDPYVKMAEKIIRAQEQVIGPIALEQAQKVPGLKIDPARHDVKFEGKEKDVVEKLVEQYKKLFGQASVEMCKDAIKSIASDMKPEEIPSSLQ